jgi:glycosyltransferase involved in cell wall biosynthesis
VRLPPRLQVPWLSTRTKQSGDRCHLFSALLGNGIPRGCVVAFGNKDGNAKGAVLLVSYFPSHKPGSQGVSEVLATHLAASGWRVLTTSSNPGRLGRLWDMVDTAWRRRREYALAHVDVFSGPAFFWAEAVCCTLRRARKPYVLTLHGGNLPAFARRWPGRVRRLFCTAAAVTSPSHYLFEHLSPIRADLQILPHLLDVRAYRFELRNQPNPRLVWLRAFHAVYNPPLAPRVLALLTRDFPDVCLTMIGPDKKDGSLQAMQQAAAASGVANRITVTGGVAKSDVPERLNKGDIFINTTNVDNAPVSVLEAMACGLCVVSTNVGGIPYMVEDGQDALLVPPDKPEAMAAAVRRILTEPRLAETLSRNARRKAEDHDWSVIVPQWERLLATVAQKHRP